MAYDRARVAERFRIPGEGLPVMEQILTETECEVLDGFLPERFPGEELEEYLIDHAFVSDRDGARRWVEQAWKRGVLWLEEDGSYCFGSFYGRLDIFAVVERSAYHALPAEQKRALDAWYFDAYVEGLRRALRDRKRQSTAEADKKSAERPTQDRVLTLEEALDFVENREDTPYLADCDCRVLKEGCEHPVNTCITYRTAENSFARKGFAVPITKEEARQVILKADQAGLVHTANPGGLCNCCDDCCYLFRASRELDLWGIWPESGRSIRVEDTCIGCKACVKRCPFGVLAFQEGHIAVKDPEQCTGFGLCREVCPVQALKLEEKKRDSTV